MSSSSNFPDSKTNGIAARFLPAILYGTAFLAVKCAIDYCCPGLSPETTASAAAGGAAFAKSTADALTGLASNIVASRMEKRIFDAEPRIPTASGLNHDIERATSRGAARSILIIYRQWRNLPAHQRDSSGVDWDSKELGASCADFLAGKDGAQQPPIIAEWLRELGEKNFLDRPELGAMPWNHSATTAAPPDGCTFAEWFEWRFPHVFRMEFAEELAHDHPARHKFQQTIHARMLDLQTESRAELAGIKDQLQKIALQFDGEKTEWLQAFARQAYDSLKRLIPDIADAVFQQLKPEFLKVAQGLASIETLIRAGFQKASDERNNHTAKIIENQDKHAGSLHEAMSELPNKILAAVTTHNADTRSWEEQVTAYASASTKNFEALRVSALGGFAEDDAAFKLSGLWVDPAVQTDYFFEEFIKEEASESVGEGGEFRLTTAISTLEPRKTAPQPAIATLCDPSKPRHIILGPAGSGKSSVLRYLFLNWIEQRANGGRELPVLILIEVREYLGARDDAENNHTNAPVENPIDYLTQTCGRAWHFDKATLLEKLSTGEAMLLIDGLDEAFEETTRERLGNWLRGFAEEHPKARIIASSRVIGFAEQHWPRERREIDCSFWEIHTLVPFDDDRIRKFLDRWFSTQLEGVQGRAAMRREIEEAIESKPFLRPLAEVPLTLTMLCALGQRGIRPDSRIAVFNKSAALFIEQWDNARKLPKEDADIVKQWTKYGESGRLEFFRSVALRMVGGGDPNDSNRISRDDLFALLKDYFAAAKDPNPSELARGILRLLCERNFLLTDLGRDTYGFFHRAFLEYFTALAWAEQFGNDFYEDPEGEKQPFEVFFEEVIEPRWQDPTWHDTLRFLFGLLKPVPALRCLKLLAEKPRVQAGKDTKNPEPLGLVYAVDFLQEVESSFTQAEAGKKKGGAVWTKDKLAEAWKTRVFEYARSEVLGNPERILWRRRALVALAANWRGNIEVAWEFAALLPGEVDWWNLDNGLGEALAVLAPGRSEIFWLLLDILLEPYRSGDIASGGLTAPVAGSGVNTGAKHFPGTTLSATRMSPLLKLAPFLEEAVRVRVRQGAVSALAAGWAGEPETKEALLLMLQDVPEVGKAPAVQAAPPDVDGEVRWRAAWELDKRWKGDADVKAVLLRVLIGVPEPGKSPSTQAVPPDSSSAVRHLVLLLLGDRGKGDSMEKAALERLATGRSADGSPIEKDEIIRKTAKQALDNWKK